MLIAVTLFSLWFSLLTNIIPVPLSKPEQQVVQLLPLWALVSFGAYSLGCIGYNLLIFRECPEAFTELEKDLAAARKRLTAQGFKFD